MANNLFREKSLKRISSPEELDRYIRVSNPSTWIVLTAILILLAGFCVWAIGGELKTVQHIDGNVKNGQLVAVLSDENSDRVRAQMPVCLDGVEVGTVSDISITSDGKKMVQIDTKNLADGKYLLDIIIEDINPMYFIFG